MSNDEPNALDDFRAQLSAAMRDCPPPLTVEIATAEGREIMFFGPGPDYVDGGTLLVPAALLDADGR